MKEQIKELALRTGFKIKKQPDGTMDLNPCVYEFAEKLMKVNLERQMRYINMIAPSHDRTSCHDSNLYNAAYDLDDFDGFGRCHRCTLLHVLIGTDEVQA